MCCPVGEARITVVGELDVPWCIHAVGPCYDEYMNAGDASLQQCDSLVRCAYWNAMVCAAEKGLGSLAFSLLAAGKFRAPQSLSKVLEAGVRRICSCDYVGLTEVDMVCFSSEEQETPSAFRGDQPTLPQ